RPVAGVPDAQEIIMASKRKRKIKVRAEDLSRPTVWRRQHGGFEPPSFDTDPDTGVVVVHHRATDTLGTMLANGTITREMYDAGTIFRTQFRRAALDNMARSPLVRLPGRTAERLSDHNIDARRKIAAALDVLGGHDGAAGSCAWHVLGLETSVREWAMRQGWNGRLV